MFLIESKSAARRVFALLSLVLLTFAPLACRAQATATNINEFPITSTSYAEPYQITYGPDGQFWFTESYASRIGSIDTISNHIQDVLVTNVGAFPFGIVTALDSNIWFTISASNQLARYNIAQSNYVTFTLPSTATNAEPSKLIVGPDGNLWFVEFILNRIASMSTSPALTNISTTNTQVTNVVILNHEYYVGRPTAQLNGLTTGPDGNLWFTETTYGIIGKLIPSTGAITEYFISNTNLGPYGITSGPDGALWFTEFGTNRIGRITTSGAITEFDLPLISGYPTPQPQDIITGADGNLWFTEFRGSAVGKITTNGTVTLYLTPTSGSFPTGLTTGPLVPGAESNIWFCEFVGGPGSLGSAYANIARLNVAQALDLNVPLLLTYSGASNTITNSGTFKNSRLVNYITLYWGDNTSSTLTITGLTNSGMTASVTNPPNSVVTVTCMTPVDTNFDAGTYSLSYTHTYATRASYMITNMVMDQYYNTAVAYTSLPAPFFTGQAPLENNTFFLRFPDSTPFGYYTYFNSPYFYHYDLGFEYFFDANDGNNGAFFYDFTSRHFWYTSPSDFPYIYDFSLNAWLYYFPNASDPTHTHYTTNPRYFYNFATSHFITQ